MSAQGQKARPGAPVLSAKPIQWAPDGDRAWSGNMGFHVEFDAEEPPESRFTASWGEGDAETFATMEEAHAWCQALADDWVREFGQAALPAPEGLGAGGRYWRDRADFWRSRAIELGWRDLRDAVSEAVEPTVLESGTPRDDLEKAVVVLKVLHESSAAQCRKDGREELAIIHDEAVSLLDYTVELHRANMTLPESDETMDLIMAEVGRAVLKFPTWPTDPLHAVAVVNEEVGELNKALLQAVYESEKSSWDDVSAEAVQAAAMAYRFVRSLSLYRPKQCEQHDQIAPAPAPAPERRG